MFFLFCFLFAIGLILTTTGMIGDLLDDNLWLLPSGLALLALSALVWFKFL